MRPFYTVFAFFILSTLAYSQDEGSLSIQTHTNSETVEYSDYEELKASKWSVGLNLGLSQSGTDTHSWGRHAESIFNQSHIAYGLQARYALNRNFGLRADYIGSTISGDDRETDGPCSDEEDLDTDIGCHRDRAWRFTSPIHELSLSFEWDILGKKRNPQLEYYTKDGKQVDRADLDLAYETYYDEEGEVLNFSEVKRFKRTLSPYVGIGAALTYVNPDVFYPDNDEYPDQADIDADEAAQKNIYLHFPVTVGLRYDLSEKLYIDGELRGVYQRTDLLDGIQHTTQFEDYRNNKDAYQFALLRVGYRLGVSEDRDGDGVEDSKDVCPDVYGVRELEGCPDRDRDGITDAVDQCPDVKGLRSFAGCPDTDGDGVQDLLDLCPEQVGSIETKGCPDADNDGLVDEEDECPNYYGPKELGGCPDYDGDGVPDHRDACPEVPGEDAYHGCNEGYPSLDAKNREKYKIKVSDRQVMKSSTKEVKRNTTTTTTTETTRPRRIIETNNNSARTSGSDSRIIENVQTARNTSSSRYGSDVDNAFAEAMTGIQFNSSQSSLKKSSYPVLNKLVRILSINKELRVSINGHTDSTGKAAKNKALSLSRAKTVKKFLMSRGIAADRMTTKGYGIEQPIADNNTPEGRKLNRRVEFIALD